MTIEADEDGLRPIVVDTEYETIDTETFQRAFKTVMRRYADTFEALAAYDRGHTVRLLKVTDPTHGDD